MFELTLDIGTGLMVSALTWLIARGYYGRAERKKNIARLHGLEHDLIVVKGTAHYAIASLTDAKYSSKVDREGVLTVLRLEAHEAHATLMNITAELEFFSHLHRTLTDSIYGIMILHGGMSNGELAQRLLARRGVRLGCGGSYRP
jgi:hypothetical protein